MHCCGGRAPPHFVVNVMNVFVWSVLTYTFVEAKLLLNTTHVRCGKEVEFTDFILCVLCKGRV